jgi:cytochrome c peroxidase
MTETKSRNRAPSMAGFAAPLLLGSLVSSQVVAQVAPSQAPPNTAPYVLKTWTSALYAPRPGGIFGSIGPVVPQTELDLNASGLLGSYQPGGGTITATNAFFQSLGTNGRSCATCHQPSSAMSVSQADIVARFAASRGTDPLFAPVDGANCPSAVPAANTSKSYLGGRMGSGRSLAEAHSLILTRGVFRIFLPLPANAEFTLRVVSDPNGCNTDPNYAQVTDPATGMVTRMVSVYRRPLLATNLKFVTTSLADLPGALPVNPLTGAPLPIDPYTNMPESGNIMWDGRDPTLQAQAIGATLSHAQALQAPSDAAVAQMVAFENGIYSAQQANWFAGNLSANGATGGPVALSNTAPAGTGFAGPRGMTLYDSWSTVTGKSLSAQQQASIYRGQVIFNTRTFSLANVPGFGLSPPPGLGGGPPGGGGAPPGGGAGGVPPGTCTLCHGQPNAGSDFIPFAQHDIGVGGDAPPTFGGPKPATDLPIFELTCLNGATSPYGTTVVQTNDPGRALITGKCADISQFTTPPLRGLASHAPYFHDGSAPDMLTLVNIYNNRFNIGYSAQDKIDLVNFLNSL